MRSTAVEAISLQILQKVIIASCSQRFPISNTFLIVLNDRIWYVECGVSVGMLLYDCWQYLLHCIDVCFYYPIVGISSQAKTKFTILNFLNFSSKALLETL